MQIREARSQDKGSKAERDGHTSALDCSARQRVSAMRGAGIYVKRVMPVVPAAIVVNIDNAEHFVTTDSSHQWIAAPARQEDPPHNVDYNSQDTIKQLMLRYSEHGRTTPLFLTKRDELVSTRFTTVTPGRSSSGRLHPLVNLTNGGYMFQGLPIWRSASLPSSQTTCRKPRDAFSKKPCISNGAASFDTIFRELGCRTQIVEQEQQHMRMQSSLAMAEATLPPLGMAALAIWDRPPDPRRFSIGAPSAIEPAEVRRSLDPGSLQQAEAARKGGAAFLAPRDRGSYSWKTEWIACFITMIIGDSFAPFLLPKWAQLHIVRFRRRNKHCALEGIAQGNQAMTARPPAAGVSEVHWHPAAAAAREGLSQLQLLEGTAPNPVENDATSATGGGEAPAEDAAWPWSVKPIEENAATAATDERTDAQRPRPIHVDSAGVNDGQKCWSCSCTAQEG
ncbi:unnamed protein product [Prorocentrum cordatum]|uniref:Uncharacterized protein n=1 Tax=Prorocentrum cordatum TaxID=2364126 RepID=A0ABN9R1M7_9DINO|nr:unnamed protein product [Polarella glacialis]